MTNTEIAEAINVLIPEGNWGAFYGDATNAEEYANALHFTGSGTAPTWEQVKAVVIPKPTESTVAEKLANFGLSIEELRTALGDNK